MVLAFGEVLIGGLHSGNVPGSGVMNVAVHAARLGSQSALISAVGRDPDGHHLRSLLAGLLVALSNGLPTAEALAAGAREGARVAGQRGAV